MAKWSMFNLQLYLSCEAENYNIYIYMDPLQDFVSHCGTQSVPPNGVQLWLKGCCKPLGKAWVFGFQNWEETSTSLSKTSASCYFGVFWCQFWSNFIWSVQGTLAAIMWHTIHIIYIGCVQWSSVALTREPRNTIFWKRGSIPTVNPSGPK